MTFTEPSKSKYIINYTLAIKDVIGILFAVFLMHVESSKKANCSKEQDAKPSAYVRGRTDMAAGLPSD